MRVGAMLLLILVSAEALTVRDKIAYTNDVLQQFEAIGARFKNIVDKVAGNIAMQPTFAKRISSIRGFLEKLGGKEGLESKLGSVVLADLGWRGYIDHSEKPTLYDRFTKFVGFGPQANERLVEIGTEESPKVDDCPEGTSHAQPCTAEQEDSSAAMFSYRNSLPIEEAHSVSAAFLFYTALWFYLFANNIGGLNSSSAWGKKPMNPGDMAKLSSRTTVSSQAPPKGHFNSSTQVSCLSGNFFFGFAVTALIVALLFAPPQQRAKLMAAALFALTAGTFQPADEPTAFDKSDYSDKDMLTQAATPETKIPTAL